MTEVPDYLLQRSRERRAALGLGGGDEGGAAEPASTPAVAADAAPAAAAAAAPAPMPDPGEIEKAEPPKPVAPWVQAAQERKKIPVWMAPVALFLPIWAFMIFGTLEEPTREAEGPIAAGGEIYSQCSACHGAGGGGGVGYQLNDGEVLLTFPDVEGHVAWVVNGTGPNVGTGYGNADRPGGQRIRGGQGNMPGFDSLSSLAVLEVVLYERVAHGLEDPELLEAYILWAESGELPEWSAGVLPQEIAGQFAEFRAINPEAEEAFEHRLEELAAE